MNLTATTHTLEMATSTAQSVTYVASYSDIDKTGTTSYTPGSSQGTVASATTTTVVSAPGSATIYRAITGFSVKNNGASSNTVTIKKDVSATEYQMAQASLATNESLHYEDSNGWYVLDATGSRKGVGATGAAGTNGSGTVLGTGSSTVDFGAGASDATVTVTGQTAILSGSLVYVWVKPTATSDHSADEHMVETIKVFAKDIVAGTGFTIHAFNTNQISEPDIPAASRRARYSGTGAAAGPGQRPRNAPVNASGGKAPPIKGQWTIGWIYTQ